MGGHGHGHGPPYHIPSPDIYKWEDIPHLRKLQERLAAKGLKDPWARNEVWRYKGVTTGTPLTRLLNVLTRGWIIAVPAFLLTIGIEKYLGIDYHAHHHEHNEHH